jgi:cell division protein FtsX
MAKTGEIDILEYIGKEPSMVLRPYIHKIVLGILRIRRRLRLKA